MKRSICTLAFLASLAGTMTASQAQTFSTDQKRPVEVTENHLRLLGKGYSNKKDKTSTLALACIALRPDGLCESARFVHGQGVRAEYIGYSIRLKYFEASEGSAQLNLTDLHEKMRMQFHGAIAASEDARAAKRLAIAVATLSTAAGLVVGLPYLGIFYTLLFVVPKGAEFHYTQMSGDLSAQTIHEAARDQNGWNWSERPKAIHPTAFNRLIQNLRTGF